MKLGLYAGDIIYFPPLGRGVASVLKRNFFQLKLNLLVSLAWLWAEPLVHYFLIGRALGSYVGPMDGVPYIKFFSPALLAITVMFIAFNESTFMFFRRHHEEGLYKFLTLAAIKVRDVAAGEILWATFKSCLAVAPIVLIAGFNGIISLDHFGALIAALASLGLFFASLGLLVASLRPTQNFLSMVQCLVVIPMGLSSGTFFPPDYYSKFFQVLVAFSPLTHYASAIRELCYGRFSADAMIALGFLSLAAVVLFNISVARTERSLIR